MKTLIPLIAVSLAATAPLRSAEIVVGPNVQVSAAHGADSHYEVLVAADPRNPKNLIVGSFIYPDDNTEAGSIVYASFDGGATWQPTLQGEDLLHTSDPAVAYGPDGEAYYVAAVLPADDHRTMRLYRSPDGGRNWGPSSTFTYSDREYVVVDTTGGKYHGRVYVNGNNRIPKGVSDIVMFYSTDQGRTFKGPGKREGFGKFTAGSMGNAVVASDGTVIAVIGENGPGKAGAGKGEPEKGDIMSSVTSVDGGESFTPAVRIDRFVPGGNRKGAQNNVNSMPVVAIDPGSAKFRDRLYVVWPDRRDGHSRIYFAWSADKGATWSKSRAIDDTPAGSKPEHLMPTVAVNKDGVVGVMWYDRRNHPDNLGWDALFTASLDGGETFIPSVQVSEAGTRFDGTQRWTALRPHVQRSTAAKDKPGTQSLQVSLNTFLFMGGDTSGLAATADGRFHPVWVDSRTGTPQVWTAPIVVKADGTPATALGKREDVSANVSIELGQPRFDRASGMLTAVAKVLNTSNQPVRGPFEVRARTITSELGEMTLVGTAGVSSDAWIFDAREIAPGQASDAQVVRLKLAGVKPFKGERRYNLGLLKMDVTITGGAAP